MEGLHFQKLFTGNSLFLSFLSADVLKQQKGFVLMPVCFGITPSPIPSMLSDMPSWSPAICSGVGGV